VIEGPKEVQIEAQEAKIEALEPGNAADLVRIDVPAFERHPVAVYLATLGSEGSRETMRNALRTIARLVVPDSDELTFPWASLEFGHTSAIRSQLMAKYAPASANKMLAAMRMVLKMAFKLGLMPMEQMARATDIPRVTGSRVVKGRAISQDELKRLFGVCFEGGTRIGARDAAVLALIYGGGLRRAEAVGLDLGDLDPGTGFLLVRGKGNKERRVALRGGALEAVKGWLAVRGDEPGPLLGQVAFDGTVQVRRLTGAFVAERVDRLAKKAGVAKLSPHDFRRTFVGDLLEAGVDVTTVQKMVGHASSNTTSRYDRRDDRTQEKAAHLLKTPLLVDFATKDEQEG